MTVRPATTDRQNVVPSMFNSVTTMDAAAGVVITQEP